MAKVINSEEFKNIVLEGKGKVLVDFYADWCGPCKMMGPILDELSENYQIYKVNVDMESDLASEYSISSIPCMILFEDGKESTRLIGMQSKSDVENILK